jgi:hypothetical protein
MYNKYAVRICQKYKMVRLFCISLPFFLFSPSRNHVWNEGVEGRVVGVERKGGAEGRGKKEIKKQPQNLNDVEAKRGQHRNHSNLKATTCCSLVILKHPKSKLYILKLNIKMCIIC